MADFLTRLAGRTLGVVPTVQPMIAPLYAPGPALLAGQESLSAFTEEVSGDSPARPSLWPAGPREMNLPPGEPLQAVTQEQESRAKLSAVSLSFSPQQDTVFPSKGEIWTGTAQSAVSAMPGENIASRRDTSSSISATGEGSQSAAAQNIAVSFPNTPLAVPDRTSSLQMREVRALPVEGAQKLAGSASFISQVYQEADAPPAAVNSVEGQRMGGVLPQSALPGASRSRANIRWAAADAATNQHELSPEGATPVTPAPTIQVTIGRIEVRATQPPPAQRQVPHPGPRMVSLEEYLDRQAKGGQ
jgi:hypothetical protein